jgi:NAD(P)-dependent dehydrogenase (short-subunit alcohol dehydrogenase family)
MKEFKDQVAVVAGGTGALGKAVTLAFLDAGATVVVTYRGQEEYDKLLSAAKGSAFLTGARIDVTDESEVGRFVDAVIKSHRKIDFLINAIGGFAGGKKFWEAQSDELEKMLSLNLRSGYLLARAVVPSMLRQAKGAIVNVASKAAETTPATLGAYAASKSAAVALINSLAADLKGTGVRVNSLLPETIDTEANRKAMPNADFAKWSRPEDIAKIVLFLCSGSASLLSGQSITV